MAANVFTFGGLKTTPQAEVVDRDGAVIPGLWAAGEMTGLYYSNYTGSTSVLRGATFGRIAGREAALQVEQQVAPA
jgi:tricarballylate dehydrogenase